MNHNYLYKGKKYWVEDGLLEIEEDFPSYVVFTAADNSQQYHWRSIYIEGKKDFLSKFTKVIEDEETQSEII